MDKDTPSHFGQDVDLGGGAKAHVISLGYFDKAPKEGTNYESIEAWRAEAARLFGDNPEDWRFRCPSCGNEAEGREYRAVGADPEAMATLCLGRFKGGRDGPLKCDWAASGLFDICRVHVRIQAEPEVWKPVFEFAPKA